ncbi:cytochrome P450 [Streptomyces sp. NPDC048282]|uniref:cytochrome P450 n=1 Tax=Streptomyces sp. NPDC048282 TaxID=3365528 RepID=UPI00370F78F2
MTHATRPPARRPWHPVEVSSKAFWSGPAPERDAAFAMLRATAPVSWQPPVEDPCLPGDSPGYWAVVAHRDIVEVSRRPEVFVSGQGVTFENMPARALRSSQSILAMDAPEHTRLRTLVSAAFTARQVRRAEDAVRACAAEVVSTVAARGHCDMVRDIAAALPTRTACGLLGVDRSEQDGVARAVTTITGWNDPEVRAGRDRVTALGEAGRHLTTVARRLIAARRREPADDLVSTLVHATVTGERLTDLEISAFFTLLCVAGIDTTQQTAAHAVAALHAYPGQREWLTADFEGRIDTAVEEMVRWASPVLTFRRTCVRDHRLGGRLIRTGEPVVLFYRSGNRDADVFAQPERFDLSRDPNPHLGFGGGGPHWCLGSQLARSQLRCLLREMFTQIPDFRAGTPVPLVGNFIHGLKSLPLRFTPVRPDPPHPDPQRSSSDDDDR